MTIRTFDLPDPGEGLTEAELVTWRVAVGDRVELNDVVVEVETAKSLVELPIPYAGVVTALLAEEGSTVAVGAPIIAVDDGVDGGVDDGVEKTGDDPADLPAGLIGEMTSTGRTAVLVGYGIKHTEAKRRPRRKDELMRTIAQPPGGAPDVQSSARPGELVAAHATAVPRDTRPVAELARTSEHLPERVRVLAAPPVRKLARDAGVDLASVVPSGPQGTITRRDVEDARSALSLAGGATGSAAAPLTPAIGREERVPIKGVRKATAAAMVASAFTAPHVTEWITLDVSATMDLRATVTRDREFAGIPISPLVLVAKAVCLAVRRNPQINASWDEAAQEIVYKNYVNLGVAAATPRGLVVPNIKDADRLTLLELAEAIAHLTATARDGRTSPADMAGGTLTITNVGVFGIDAGTPILNPGEAAILALGAISRRPWVVGSGAQERIEPRWVTTLALSFDHRVVDGELGSRFLADLARLLTDPGHGLLWA